MSSVAANLGLQSGGSGFERTPDAQANLNSTNPVSQMSTADDADFNPRSPKRRRLSPPSDDGVFDIGAAAARALALSLGGEVPNLSTVSDTLQTSQAPSRQDTPVQPMASLPIKPTRQARLENLPGLRDLASKILLFLARLNHLEIGEMLFGPPSTRAQEYRLLKQKFDDGKRLYLVGSSPFLAAQLLELDDAEHVDMLRRINLAIFMASIFSGEIGLRIMDINFIDVFVPEGGRLLKAQGSIYLELKTHAFMAATRTASTMLNQVMMDLFPSDMEKFLIQKRPGAKGLAPSEQDFLNRLGSRRDILYSVIRSNTLNTLPDTYRWNDFAREVSLYLTKFIGDEGHGVKDLADVFSESATDSAVSRNLSERQEMLKSLTSLDTNDQTQNSYASSSQTAINFELPFDIQAMVAHAARTAALTMGDSIDMTLLPPTADNALTADPPSTNMGLDALEVTEPQISPATVDISPSDVKTPLQGFPEATEYVPISNGAATDQESSEIPHSSQTAPTQVLYERARQVNTNKALALKKAALPTHRRPWTTEEENALMTGLDEVKGPHWSQILAMYGPGGTVNESLKDRNQVQLKDKARNLKLFFLKAGIEVPYYLQAVTGDLKTRAPGQAEKMERERMMGEVERSLTDDFQSSGDFSDVQDSEHIRSIGVAQSGEDATDEKDQHSGIAGTTDIGLEFDMEAMIAQAAASASRGLGPPV